MKLLPYRPHLKDSARTLRRKATFPERLLWSRLRRRALGVKFLRQRPIGSYVVDFYSPERQLVVEIDGRSHDGQYAKDQTRQRALEHRGLHILRFTNDEVLEDIDGVEHQIVAWLAQHSPSNNPPSNS